MQDCLPNDDDAMPRRYTDEDWDAIDAREDVKSAKRGAEEAYLYHAAALERLRYWGRRCLETQHLWKMGELMQAIEHYRQSAIQHDNALQEWFRISTRARLPEI